MHFEIQLFQERKNKVPAADPAVVIYESEVEDFIVVSPIPIVKKSCGFSCLRPLIKQYVNTQPKCTILI